MPDAIGGIPVPQSNITRDVQPVVPSAGGKIKVMKRSTSGNRIDKKTSTDKSSSTFNDKEKAYAEVRARIFGEDITASPISNNDGNNKLDVPPTVNGHLGDSTGTVVIYSLQE